MQLDKTCLQLSETESSLKDTKEILSSTQKLLSETATDRDEQMCLVNAHVSTEARMKREGSNLINVADQTTEDISLLQDKLDRQR